MISKDFLNTKLNEIYKTLPYLEIRYEYKAFINTHVVEVLPIHCFEDDKQYIDKQIELEDEFELAFPDQEILFVTENELISIENPEFVYGVKSEECDFEWISPVPVNYKVEDFKPYYFDTKINTEFVIPEPPPKAKTWWKKSIKSKKALTDSQGFFCNIVT